MTENQLADKLEAVADALTRGGWPVDPIDYSAPDSVLAGRLAHEERRLRAMGERDGQ